MSAASGVRYPDPGAVKTIGVVGAGSVGSSWITFALARGLAVVATDPKPDAPVKLRAFAESTWPAMVAAGLADRPAPPFELLRFVADAGTVAREAEFIFEAAPEYLDAKIALFKTLDLAARPETILATSTGGFLISDIQSECRHPERVVLIHPLNPAHLVPMVEVCGGKKTDPRVVDWAQEFCRVHHKVPVKLNHEAIGHVSNRLQSAVLREAVHCVLEGIADPKTIDTVMTEGLGARWAMIRPLTTLHLAGGLGGMAAILAHTGDALNQWWAALGSPTLSKEVRARLVELSKNLDGGDIAGMIRVRDENLVRAAKAHTGDR